LENLANLRIDRTFDLALCLECAEHLSESVAPTLVAALANVATHVVFSAAVPGQTGVGHINEQYPDYWRDLFAIQGFQMFDFFRPLIWNDERVEFWYRQNMYLFSKAPHVFRKPASVWNGSVYITRDLLERYIRWLSLSNGEKLRLERIVKDHDSSNVAKLKRLINRTFRFANRLQPK